MKLLTSILILLSIAIGGLVILETYELIEFQTSLVDYPDNGNSEKDSKENSEDDFPKKSFSPLEFNSLEANKESNLTNHPFSNPSNYLEVPVPPPDHL